MSTIYACITEAHDLRLVVLAVLVCAIACHTCMTLLSRAQRAEGRPVLWLVAAGFALGGGTWATHFVAMLAYQPGMNIGYDVPTTVLSILIAVAGSVAGLSLYVRPDGSWRSALAAGAVTGMSIVAMHFIGMTGVRVAGRLAYDPDYVALAVAFSVGLSTAAQLVRSPADTPARRLASGAILSLAIFLLHFTAMTAVTVVPDPAVGLPEGVLATGPMAMAVASVAVAILLCGLAGAMFDRHLESRTQHELRRIRQLTEASLEGICVCRDGKIVDTNSAMCAFLGRTPSELLGRPIEDLVAPDSLDAFRRATRAETQEPERVGFSAAGGRFHIAELLTRRIDYDGEHAQVILIRDVTDRMRNDLLRDVEYRVLRGITEDLPVEEILHLLCRAIEQLLDGAMCSVLLVTPDGRRLRHAAAPSLPLEFCAAIDGAEIGPAVGSCGTAAYRAAPVVSGDIARDPLWADYRAFALEAGLRSCWSTPLFSRTGTVIGTFAIYHRVPHFPTESDRSIVARMTASAAIAIQRSLLVEALVAEKERAQEASRAKSEFLANMSHELRTPLNAILGFSEMIERQMFGPQNAVRSVEYARDINRSGQHLLSLINDLLDVTRIEAKSLNIEKDRCNVHIAVAEQRQLVRRAVPDAAQIEIAPMENCPDLLAGSRAFAQILLNVIGNAAKFTPANGRITVRADWAPPGLRIVVEDTGPGIPAEALKDLATPFRQVSNAYSRGHGGTGLGLYISRSLMEAHGGSLDIASTVGVGTQVTLRFPENAVMRAIGAAEISAARTGT
ncbi:MAG: GAF domain-containing protein [Rhodospirillales bacterium]|nr:GAF domain-containing protein [Rhodospirillales bacterium]